MIRGRSVLPEPRPLAPACRRRDLPPPRPPAAQPDRLDVPALLTLCTRRATSTGRWRPSPGRRGIRHRSFRRCSCLRATVGRTQCRTARPRLLVAAAFGLEFEAVRVERGDWLALTVGPIGPRAIEWACTVLRARGRADDAERVWFLASFALVGGVRDWTFVYSPLAPSPRTGRPGTAARLARFPDEPRFKLARAMAIAARYESRTKWPRPGG